MDPILGQIQLFPFQWSMTGWMPCEGQMLQITQNAALFSLIGGTYGGDGRVTFALPDLKGSEPHPEMRYFIAVQGAYPQRA